MIYGGSAEAPAVRDSPRQLNQLLGELHQHQFTPARLRALASRLAGHRELPDKLHDLALLDDACCRWLVEHELQDANRLLDIATDVLRETGVAASRQSAAISAEQRGGLPTAATIQQLWLDGFAEMTPQELDLLAAILRHCGRATLAFCLENEPRADASWLSIWSSVGKTFQQCRQRLENLPDCKISVEMLARDPDKNRFAENSALARLEQNWESPVSLNSEHRTPGTAFGSGAAGRATARVETERDGANPSISLIACQNPEAEAAFAAREILKSSRTGRGCATALCSCETSTTITSRWRANSAAMGSRFSWIAANPSPITRWPNSPAARCARSRSTGRTTTGLPRSRPGFPRVEEIEIDRLENAALEFGWRGEKWREPLPAADPSLERLRQKIVPPFENLCRATGATEKPANR